MFLALVLSDYQYLYCAKRSASCTSQSIVEIWTIKCLIHYKLTFAVFHGDKLVCALIIPYLCNNLNFNDSIKYFWSFSAPK